jgi:catechol 2,3-dioxygenase-like lactoylglutathione lyase family enzyme
MIGTPHHVGCAVPRLSGGVATYSGALGLTRRSRPFAVTSQCVEVCFLELADGFFLELVAPLDDKARLSSFLRVGFYHLCFLVDDLEPARLGLRARGFHPFPAFASEAFDGAPCQFFLTPDKHLVELAQISTARFRDFFASNIEHGC